MTRATKVPTFCDAMMAELFAGSVKLRPKRGSVRCSSTTPSRKGGSACVRDGKRLASTQCAAKDAAAAGLAAARSDAANDDFGTSTLAGLPANVAPGVSTLSVSSIAAFSSASMRDAVCGAAGRVRCELPARAAAPRSMRAWLGSGCSRYASPAAFVAAFAAVVALMSALRMPRVITAQARACRGAV